MDRKADRKKKKKCSNKLLFFLSAKKMKDSLSSFLPNLPGVIDTPGSQDNRFESFFVQLCGCYEFGS